MKDLATTEKARRKKVELNGCLHRPFQPNAACCDGTPQTLAPIRLAFCRAEIFALIRIVRGATPTGALRDTAPRDTVAGRDLPLILRGVGIDGLGHGFGMVAEILFHRLVAQLKLEAAAGIVVRGGLHIQGIERKHVLDGFLARLVDSEEMDLAIHHPLVSHVVDGAILEEQLNQVAAVGRNHKALRRCRELISVGPGVCIAPCAQSRVTAAPAAVKASVAEAISIERRVGGAAGSPKPAAPTPSKGIKSSKEKWRTEVNGNKEDRLRRRPRVRNWSRTQKEPAGVQCYRSRYLSPCNGGAGRAHRRAVEYVEEGAALRTRTTGSTWRARVPAAAIVAAATETAMSSAESAVLRERHRRMQADCG